MTEPNVRATIRVRWVEAEPVIETEVRPITPGGPIPLGMRFVVRIPILPPGATADETRSKVERVLLLDALEPPPGGLSWLERLDPCSMPSRRFDPPQPWC